MRREAERARLMVVNHHLFFADLALRGPHPGRVLPDYDAVIFDEAHQLEDIATEFFGMRVSRRRLDRLLADAERALRAAGARDPLFGGDSAIAQRERGRGVGRRLLPRARARPPVATSASRSSATSSRVRSPAPGTRSTRRWKACRRPPKWRAAAYRRRRCAVRALPPPCRKRSSCRRGAAKTRARPCRKSSKAAPGA